jgi:hypothetical protein
MRYKKAIGNRNGIFETARKQAQSQPEQAQVTAVLAMQSL